MIKVLISLTIVLVLCLYLLSILHLLIKQIKDLRKSEIREISIRQILLVLLAFAAAAGLFLIFIWILGNAMIKFWVRRMAWYLVLTIAVSVGSIAIILLARRIVFVFQKIAKNPKVELNTAEVLIFSFACFVAIFPLVFVFEKIVSYSGDFLHKIFEQTIQNRIGAGLICGFICTATMGYTPYLFLAPRLSLDNFEDSFFFEHHQKRVGAVTSFIVGQCFKFLFFYNLPVYEALYKPNLIVLIFLAFFVFQVIWTHETIVRNWKYLYPNDKRKKVFKRILFVQLEFVANFFIQGGPTNSQVEKLNSTVREISAYYIHDKVFLRMTFVGWFLGHIVFTPFYTKVFELLRVLVYPYIKNMFDSKGDDSKGDGGRNEVKKW